MENLGGIGNPTFDLKLNGSSPDVAQVLLRINEVLTGEVLQLLDGGSIVLGVGKHRIPAQSHVELNVGDRIRFQVVPQGEEIILKVLPEEAGPPAAPGSFEAFQKLAGQDRPIAEVLGKLAEVLVILSGSDPKTFASGQGASGRPSLPLDPQTQAFLRDLLQAAVPSAEQAPPAFPAPAAGKILAPPPSQPYPPAASTAAPLLSSLAPAQVPSSSAPADSGPNLSPPEPTPAPSALPALPLAGAEEVPIPPASPDLGEPARLPVFSVPESAPQPPSEEKAASLPQLPQPIAARQAQESRIPAPQGAGSKDAGILPGPLRPDLVRSIPPETLAKLKRVLAVPQLQEKVQALAKALEKAVVKERTNPESLRRSVEEGSVPAESRLRLAVEGRTQETPRRLAYRDFKTFLLGFERDLETVSEKLRRDGDPEVGKKVQELRAEVREAREAIESKQVQNAFRQDAGQPLHFQIPFHEGGKLRSLDLFYQKKESRRSAGAEPPSHHLVFLLEMSRLGAMRVDALMRQPQIDLRFRLEEDEAARFLQGKLPELSFALRSLGFQVGLLECAVGRCRDEENEGAPALDLPVLREKRLLDLEG